MFCTENDYFYNYVDLSIRDTRTTRNLSYNVPMLQPKSMWGKHAFQFVAAELWLKLPDRVKSSASSFFTFKNASYAYLLSKQIDETLYYHDDYNDDILSCIEFVIQSYSNSN